MEKIKTTISYRRQGSYRVNTVASPSSYIVMVSPDMLYVIVAGTSPFGVKVI